MSSLGLIHMVFGSVSLLAGALVLVMRKGTRLHRAVGHFYFTGMLALNVSSLFIYRLFGRFGPFHVLAVISLATVLSGMVPVIGRLPRKVWLDLHSTFMEWSYVGLLAAAVSELTTRVLSWPFAVAVIIPSAIIIAVGGTLIQMRMSTARSRLPARFRREFVAD